MFSPILVAFATRYGSTREVAEAIARVLRGEGHEVVVEEMAGVRSIEPFRAVVMGAPFYGGAWHGEAPAFLDRFRAGLIERPVAVFALGPVGTQLAEIEAGRRRLLEELARRPWLHPIAAEMFGGRYDPEHLDLLHKIVAAMPGSPLYGMPPSDLRDWPAIRAWADVVARMLNPAVPAPMRSTA